jgi:hypothetical protein
VHPGRRRTARRPRPTRTATTSSDSSRATTTNSSRPWRTSRTCGRRRENENECEEDEEEEEEVEKVDEEEEEEVEKEEEGEEDIRETKSGKLAEWKGEMEWMGGRKKGRLLRRSRGSGRCRGLQIPGRQYRRGLAAATSALATPPPLQLRPLLPPREPCRCGPTASSIRRLTSSSSRACWQRRPRRRSFARSGGASEP